MFDQLRVSVPRHRLAGAVFALLLAAVALMAQAAPGSTGSVTPVRPYTPGDKVWTSAPPVTALTDSGTGCQRVPASGYVGHNVYAQTSVKYSSYWSWSAASAVESFHWYVFNSGGALTANGGSSGGGAGAAVPANNNYWKVQNQGADPQAWNVCWS